MTANRDLVMTRDIAVPREKHYWCGTEPGLVKQWLEPKRWSTQHAEIDALGGASFLVTRGLDGNGCPGPAEYPQVVPNEQIVATDACTRALSPFTKQFMTFVLTFEDLGGCKTRYTAGARHRSDSDREADEKSDSADGWARGADLLAELAGRP